jgi:pimeloyl-ACP methyl ester carboxylesterase
MARGKAVTRAIPCLLTMSLLAGCASVPARVEVGLPAPPEPSGAAGVVVCADGAGGFGGTTRALRTALAEQGSPLAVQCFEWSHGYGRVLADQMDCEHAQAEGRKLAQCVLAYRARCPGQPIYLVAHSAGSNVVLCAAGALPAGSVERIVLLAPAVSADYDLRPALRCARSGIDVFYSERDWPCLGLGIGIIGTSDRRWSAAAGRVGFRPVIECPADAALYRQLHQHGWDPCVSWSGNTGGHYGSYRPGFLRAYVLPLLPARAG